MVDKGERIFLLEVFVDNVHLENCKVDNKLVKTCVRFKFLNYPFLEIMEDEYCKVPDETCNIKFQSGKSCLFSLRKNPQGSKKPPLNLHVSVVRMDSETSAVDIGKTVINLSGSFTNLIQTANQRPENNNPVSKIIKETYVLTNDKNQTIGDITIFVRLSCFGKIIVTQFQMSGLESKSFLFKAVSDIRGKKFEGSGDAEGVFDSSLPQVRSQGQLDPQQSGAGGTGQMGSGIGPQQGTYPQGMMPPPGMGYPPLGMTGPGMGQPGMMGPGMGQPGMMGPGMGQPGMMGPGMGQPGMMGPGMGQPGMMGPGIGQPGMMGPGMGQPGIMGPGMGQPGMGYHPGMMGPGMGQPGVMGPGTGPPSMTGQGMTQPGMMGPGSCGMLESMKPFGELGLSAQQGGLDYKNFSATVNGHVLNIKVLRKPKKLKQPEAIFCQRYPADDSSSTDSEDDRKKKKKKHKCDAECSLDCPAGSRKMQAGAGQPGYLNNCPSSCPTDRPIPRIPLCDCDIPIPPCLVCPPPPPPPPPKKKKKKKKGFPPCPRDAGMYCKTDCPLGFPTPPGLLPPNYPVPSVFGASPTATGDQQNFLISMEPRKEYPPIVQPPKPTCITVRDTQYDETDLGGDAKKTRASKSKGGKGKKGKKK